MIASVPAMLGALQADFDALATAAYSWQAIRWPNAEFTPPAPAQDALWASFDVVMGDAVQVEAGGPGRSRHRHPGVVMITIYQTPGTGDAYGLSDAHDIGDHYRAASIAGAQFRTPTIEAGTLAGGWWATRVRCPFFADRIA